jgi:ADP-ribosylglycohydrolase
MTTQNTAACLMGALVADAAALGLHWIYDPERIASVADAHGRAAFMPLNPAHFDGVRSYYVHGQRSPGALTQYGEVLHLAIQSLIASNGHLDESAYQQAYAAHFGPGGRYTGYIDRPTRGTLANLATGQTDPSGVDDDQHPAIATLPAIVVARLGKPDLSTSVAQAIRVTNVNDTALDYGMAFAALLSLVLGGQPVQAALQAIATGATGDLGARLTAALTNRESSTVFGAVTGRACHLPMGLPLAFHILATSGSFAEANEANIRAGGDSAGRAIIIGSVMGAANGIGTENGIPIGDLLQKKDAATLWQHCQQLEALA